MSVRRALLTPSECSGDYDDYYAPVPLPQAHSLNAPAHYAKSVVSHESNLTGAHNLAIAQSTISEPEKIQINCSSTFLLVVAYSVFFTRYCVATGLSSFFPQKAEEIGMSEIMIGLIFTSFPVGIGIASIFGRRFLLKIGTRLSVAYSLLLTSCCSLCFGFTPDFTEGKPNSTKAILFFLFYFLNGLFGGFAECGTTIMLTQQFRARVGLITVAIGSVCGLGCMIGPLLGGVLYNISSNEEANFRLPFICLAVLEIILSVLVLIVYTDFSLETMGNKRMPLMRNLFTTSRTVTLTTIAISGTFIGSLDPTLALRVEKFGFSESLVGVCFMVSSIAYVLTSIPVGWLVDHLPGDDDPPMASRFCKGIQACGMFLFCFAFLMLGPSLLGGNMWKKLFDNATSVWIAMIFKGIASNGMNAGYPDLVIGVDDGNELVQATISALWNAAYALGWALGPLSGGIMVSFLGFSGYATVLSLVALFWGATLTLFMTRLGELKIHSVEPVMLYTIQNGSGTEGSQQSEGWKSWTTAKTAFSFHSHRSYR